MTSPPLLVLDASVFAPATAFTDSAAAEVMRLVRSGDVLVAGTAEIEAEYMRLPGKPDVRRLLQRSNCTIQDLLGTLADARRVMTLMTLAGEAPPCRDETDRKYLHCAVAAGADYLVTDDKDMLVLETVGTTAILRPRDLLERLRALGG